MSLLQLSAARDWWLVSLRGICAIGFGVLALAWPGLTIEALVLLFGAYALIDGIAALATALLRSPDRVWHGIEGVLGIAVGMATFLIPAFTAMALLVAIAAWVVALGIVRIVVALRVGHGSAWALGLSGALSIILGAMLIAFPETTAIALVWLVALNAIVFGAFFLVMGLRLRTTAPAVFVQR